MLARTSARWPWPAAVCCVLAVMVLAMVWTVSAHEIEIEEHTLAASQPPAPAAFAWHQPGLPPKNILLLPFIFGASHSFIMAKIGRELAKHHNVTMLRSNVDSDKIDYSGLKTVHVQMQQTREFLDEKYLSFGSMDPVESFKGILDITLPQCTALLDSKELMEAWTRADLVLVDGIYPCHNMVSHYFPNKLRVDLGLVGFCDPMGVDVYGIPSPLASIHLMGLVPPETGMTIVHRTANRLLAIVIRYLMGKLRAGGVQLMHDRGETSYRVTSVYEKIDLVLFAVDFNVHPARLLPPFAKTIGPITPSPAKPIDDPELKTFIERAGDQGFIFVSFGTLGGLSAWQGLRILAAVQAQKLPIIWKTTARDAAWLKLAQNLLLRSWVPQNDLLGHPKCRLFVSHGGANGVGEAAYHGVPVAGYPLFGDQHYNLVALRQKGMAKILEDSHSSESLERTVQQLLTDDSFRQRAQDVSRRTRDRIMTPTEEVGFWVEYVIRNNGTKHLLPKSMKQSAFVRDGYDVLLLVTAVLTGICGLALAIGRWCWRQARRAIYGQSFGKKPAVIASAKIGKAE